MSSYVDMSLEDIIKKKRENTSYRAKNKVKAQPYKLSPKTLPKNAPITDARNKIISKNRTQVTDARGKLAQLGKPKDARFKLEKIRQERARVPGPVRNTFPNRGIFARAPPTKERLFTDSSRQVVSQPLTTSKSGLKRQMNTETFTEARSKEKSRLFEFQHKPKPKPLPRTVENDLEITDEPMPDEYVPQTLEELNRVANAEARSKDKSRLFEFQYKPKYKPLLRTVENDLETTDEPMPDEYIPQTLEELNRVAKAEARSKEKSRLFEFQYKPKPKPLLRTVEDDLEITHAEPALDEYIPQTLKELNRVANLQLKILIHNNDVRESSVATIDRTIVAEKEKPPPTILNKLTVGALRSDRIVKNSEKPRLEYKIIVSNLRNTVTGGDIQELFGDVGIMLESRLVRPGNAEVIYATQEDAQEAVDLYHTRLLDGQPMNCLLVSPTIARSGNKPDLYRTNSNVEPDSSTFH